MGIEIERKFLVRDESWRHAETGSALLRQGYLSRSDKASVRVRTIGEADAAITIKSAGTRLVRGEFEYAIPIADALELLALRTGLLIEKRRHQVPHAGKRWEVDVFAGPLAGLVLAELELSHEDEPFERPPWLGEEVTHDPRYFNSALAREGLPR